MMIKELKGLTMNNREKEVYEAYIKTDRHWDDCLEVVRSSPLKSMLFNATEWLANKSIKYGQYIVDKSFNYTIGSADDIITQIVCDSVAIFDEWGDEPIPDTVFEAYVESEAIWDIYEMLIQYSPVNWVRSRILGYIGITFPTTRIGEWATLLQADHYLSKLDTLIRHIIEHALDAYENVMDPDDDVSSSHDTMIRHIIDHLY